MFRKNVKLIEKKTWFHCFWWWLEWKWLVMLAKERRTDDGDSWPRAAAVAGLRGGVLGVAGVGGVAGVAGRPARARRARARRNGAELPERVEHHPQLLPEAHVGRHQRRRAQVHLFRHRGASKSSSLTSSRISSFRFSRSSFFLCPFWFLPSF